MKKTELRNDGTLFNQLEIGDVVRVSFLEQDDLLSDLRIGDKVVVTKINDYCLYNKLSVEVEVENGFWDMYNYQLDFVPPAKNKTDKKKAEVEALKVEINRLTIGLAKVVETLSDLIK